jgi:hypothetical protein
MDGCDCYYCQLQRIFHEKIRNMVEHARDEAELSEIEELEQLYKKEYPLL